MLREGSDPRQPLPQVLLELVRSVRSGLLQEDADRQALGALPRVRLLPLFLPLALPSHPLPQRVLPLVCCNPRCRGLTPRDVPEPATVPPVAGFCFSLAVVE